MLMEVVNERIWKALHGGSRGLIVENSWHLLGGTEETHENLW
jgi:hypothetical protein